MARDRTDRPRRDEADRTSPVLIAAVVLGALAIAAGSGWFIFNLRAASQLAAADPPSSRHGGPGAAPRTAALTPAAPPVTITVEPPPPVPAPNLQAYIPPKGPAAPESSRATGFDATAGTKLDPLNLKGWDLTTPKSVPDFKPIAPAPAPAPPGRAATSR